MSSIPTLFSKPAVQISPFQEGDSREIISVLAPNSTRAKEKILECIERVFSKEKEVLSFPSSEDLQMSLLPFPKAVRLFAMREVPGFMKTELQHILSHTGASFHLPEVEKRVQEKCKKAALSEELWCEESSFQKAIHTACVQYVVAMKLSCFTKVLGAIKNNVQELFLQSLVRSTCLIQRPESIENMHTKLHLEFLNTIVSQAFSMKQIREMTYQRYEAVVQERKRQQREMVQHLAFLWVKGMAPKQREMAVEHIVQIMPHISAVMKKEFIDLGSSPDEILCAIQCSCEKVLQVWRRTRKEPFSLKEEEVFSSLHSSFIGMFHPDVAVLMRIHQKAILCMNIDTKKDPFFCSRIALLADAVERWLASKEEPLVVMAQQAMQKYYGLEGMSQYLLERELFTQYVIQQAFHFNRYVQDTLRPLVSQKYPYIFPDHPEHKPFFQWFCQIRKEEIGLLAEKGGFQMLNATVLEKMVEPISRMVFNNLIRLHATQKS